VLTPRESYEFMQICCKPFGFFRKVNKPILDGAGNCVKAHDFVHRWLIGLRRIDSLVNQLLKQLSTRSSVLNQYDFGSKSIGLLSHGTLQFRIVDALAVYVQ